MPREGKARSRRHTSRAGGTGAEAIDHVEADKPRPSEVMQIGEEVLAWQALQGYQRAPDPRSADKHEQLLGKRFDDVLRRQYQAIGVKPCQRQLSRDEVDFIKEILLLHRNSYTKG